MVQGRQCAESDQGAAVDLRKRSWEHVSCSSRWTQLSSSVISGVIVRGVPLVHGRDGSDVDISFPGADLILHQRVIFAINISGRLVLPGVFVGDGA